MLSIRHSIGKTPLLEHMANDSKSVAHFRCYAIAPPPGVYAPRNLVASFGSTELRFARLRLRDGPPLAAPILQPAGFGCWRVFCPAQAAVALLVFDRAAAQSTQCLQRLLRHLPGVGLVL